jgi:hypothetical protein
MRFSLAVFSFATVLSLSLFAADRDDYIAPVPVAPLPVAPQTEAPAAPINIWHRKWNYDAVAISNREVFRSKSYWGFVAADLAAGAFDSEMSHEGYAHHRCVEGGDGLPPYASRWQHYQHNLPEEALVVGVGYFWTKIKGPKWVMPGLIAYPVEAHIRAGLAWEQNCW